MTYLRSKAHRFIFPFGFLVATMTGCSSVPETLSEQGVERISQIPSDARLKIQSSLKKYFTHLSAQEIESYLNTISKRLLSKSKLSSPLRIELVTTRESALSKAKLWVVPPEKGYLDDHLLRSLEFENEIAAVIAFNWERVQDIEFEKRFIHELDQLHPDFSKIYEFSELEDMKAVEGAIDLLYQAGYDPRGLMSVFGRKIGVSPERALVLQEKARRTNAFYKPLMNPTIRSDEYYRMRKKLEKL